MPVSPMAAAEQKPACPKCGRCMNVITVREPDASQRSWYCLSCATKFGDAGPVDWERERQVVGAVQSAPLSKVLVLPQGDSGGSE